MHARNLHDPVSLQPGGQLALAPADHAVEELMQAQQPPLSACSLVGSLHWLLQVVQGESWPPLAAVHQQMGHADQTQTVMQGIRTLAQWWPIPGCCPCSTLPVWQLGQNTASR